MVACHWAAIVRTFTVSSKHLQMHHVSVQVTMCMYMCAHTHEYLHSQVDPYISLHTWRERGGYEHCINTTQRYHTEHNVDTHAHTHVCMQAVQGYPFARSTLCLCMYSFMDFTFHENEQHFEGEVCSNLVVRMMCLYACTTKYTRDS